MIEGPKRRIVKEFKQFQDEQIDLIRVERGIDFTHCVAYLSGPPDTNYEGGVFKLNYTYPMDFPFRPPKCSFVTKVYHPNIKENGLVSIDILANQYSLSLTLRSILLSILSLLDDPNPHDPVEPQIAAMYLNNRAQYNRIAREWTRNYAMQ